uniref:ATP synthase complex subunit 8 n=1 Tax=Priolepis semidoliata TaxID=1156130 RepID=A0A5K7TNQ1_9GOBI|nr:ATPase subunit 8 [Priolepis semidoliata]
MPQLNPAPWFSILVFSWLVIFILVLPLTLAHTTNNEPSTQNPSTLKTQPWTWPWT